MVEIKLNREEEIVLGIIREKYLNTKCAVNTDTIYAQSRRDNLEDWKVRRTLMNLSQKSLIFRKGDSFSWEPKFELKQQQAISRMGVSFSTSKILDCIRKINRPAKPNEVLMKFIEIYGMPENVETFLRHMRTLGEDPDNMVKRDQENNYWISTKAIVTRDTTLDQFAV